MPDENFLIPTIAQDADTGQVLMLAYSNRDSLRETLETGEVHYWSRSRNCLWKKGETSGNRLKLVSASIDCDSDALLFRVHPAGPACHTGAVSCFYTPVEDVNAAILQGIGLHEGIRGEYAGRKAERHGGGATQQPGAQESHLTSRKVPQPSNQPVEQQQRRDAFVELFSVIESRRREKPEDSYTAKLIGQGVDRISKKIAEEAGEVIIAAKNRSKDELLWESADLIYHLMVLLSSQGVQWSELAEELDKRRK